MKRIFKKEPVISFKIIKTNITYGGYYEKHKVEYMIKEEDHYKIISERRFDIYTSTWNKDKEIRTTKLTNSIPFPIYSFRDISDFLIIRKRIDFLELNIPQKTYFEDKISLLDAKNEMKK